MEKRSVKPAFMMEVLLDEEGKPHTITRNHGLPYDVIVSALSHQLHLYNQLWAKNASTTIEEK
jgi:hypothetical protein